MATKNYYDLEIHLQFKNFANWKNDLERIFRYIEMFKRNLKANSLKHGFNHGRRRKRIVI